MAVCMAKTIVANANHNYELDPMNMAYRGQKHLLNS